MRLSGRRSRSAELKGAREIPARAFHAWARMMKARGGVSLDRPPACALSFEGWRRKAGPDSVMVPPTVELRDVRNIQQGFSRQTAGPESAGLRNSGEKETWGRTPIY